jgi:predicted Zn-dependent peptidase
VERHFSDVPTRPAPEPPDLDEPDLAGERRHAYVDNLAPLPAFAAAWRVPDPVEDFGAYMPFVVLANLLADGNASRLVQRLVLTDRSATKVDAYVSLSSEPFFVRDPTALIIQARLQQGATVDPVLAAVVQECDRLAQGGLAEGELARTVSRMSARLLREADVALTRALYYAVLERQRGDAALADALPGLLAEVTEEQVRRAAACLVPSRRAVVEVIQGRAGTTGRSAGRRSAE